MADLTLQQRLQATAVADRLIYGSEHSFDRQDAIDLLAFLPRQGFGLRLLSVLPGVQVKGEISGPGLAGAAAGIGQVKTEEKKSIELDSQGRVTYRAGQWRLYRAESLLRPGSTTLTLEQVMGSEIDDARTAHIVYRRGEPQMMLLNRVSEIRIGRLTAAYVKSVPWKQPVDGPRPAADRSSA